MRLFKRIINKVSVKIRNYYKVPTLAGIRYVISASVIRMILKDHPNDINYRKILNSEERNCKRYKRLACKVSAFDTSSDKEIF